MTEYPGLFDAEVEGLAGDEQADDQTEEAEDGAEDLDDEDLDEAVRGWKLYVSKPGGPERSQVDSP